MKQEQSNRAAFWQGVRSIFGFAPAPPPPIEATFRGYDIATVRAEEVLAQDWQLLSEELSAPRKMVEVQFAGQFEGEPSAHGITAAAARDLALRT